MTVTEVECDSEPLVPVTVTVYVPKGVNVVVVTLRIEVPVPPELRVTVGGFRGAVIVDVLGTTVDDNETVPEKPLLARVICEVPKLPAAMFRDVGLALMEKSGSTTKLPNIEKGWMVQ